MAFDKDSLADDDATPLEELTTPREIHAPYSGSLHFITLDEKFRALINPHQRDLIQSFKTDDPNAVDAYLIFASRNGLPYLALHDSLGYAILETFDKEYARRNQPQQLAGTPFTPVNFDNQGRILIPQPSRNFLSLEKQVLVVPASDKRNLELWKPETHFLCTSGVVLRDHTQLPNVYYTGDGDAISIQE